MSFISYKCEVVRARGAKKSKLIACEAVSRRHMCARRAHSQCMHAQIPCLFSLLRFKALLFQNSFARLALAVLL